MAILDSRIHRTTPLARLVPISVGVMAFGVLALGDALVQVQAQAPAAFDSLPLGSGQADSSDGGREVRGRVNQAQHGSGGGTRPRFLHLSRLCPGRSARRFRGVACGDRR